MIIDTHIHFFKDELADRARKKMSAAAKIPYYTDFTEADTRKKLRDWGVDIGIVLPIATLPAHQENVNNWAAGIQGDGVLSCGSIHPEAPDAIEELHRIKELGLIGIKLHPVYQNFYVDDERIYPVYEEICKLGFPVVLHSGYDPISPDCPYVPPARVARLRDAFPQMKLIAAHLGGVLEQSESAEHLIGTDIILDLSVVPVYMEQEHLERVIKTHGAHRLVFGSDTPWCLPTDVIAVLEKCHLSSEEMDCILYKNAAEIFDIDINAYTQKQSSAG